MDEREPDRFNPNEWVPAIMALGTWLFAMYCAYKGIHYVPDEWVIGIILAPYGNTLYCKLRDRLGDLVKRIPKKD